jgi:sigma-B regulation protein RsbU (phosphoserine phosphatase)
MIDRDARGESALPEQTQNQYRRPTRRERVKKKLELFRHRRLPGQTGPVSRRRLHDRLATDPWGYIDLMFHSGMRVMILGANFMGLLICVLYFVFLDDIFALSEVPYFKFVPLTVFTVVSATAMLASRRWIKDISETAAAKAQGQTPPEPLLKIAQRKIMDFPIWAARLSLSAWFLSAVIVAAYRFFAQTPGTPMASAFIQSVKTFVGIMTAGGVTAAIILFITEVVCQSLRPYFFREGEPAHQAGRYKLDLRSRLFVSYLLTGLMPMLLLAVLSFNKVRLVLTTDPADVVQSLFSLTVFILVTATFVSFVINHLLEHSIIDPIEDLEAAMDRVETGDFSTRLSVTSNDEIGALADRFNAMTTALKEGERMRHSLVLAREVQQNLLPRRDPLCDGLDIAGRSIYCDETGGDYFDFLEEPDQDRFSVVIADVAEHGVSSALLMATTRAVIRECSARTDNPAEVAAAANRVMVRDVEESGRFVTMSLVRFDLRNRRLVWVSAGHDPAMLFDPASEGSLELAGGGPALGLMADAAYTSRSQPLASGQVVVLGTDGIWEAHDQNGTAFGKEKFRQVVREHLHLPARDIVGAVVDAVAGHCRPRGMEDDVTLAVVKVL